MNEKGKIINPNSIIFNAEYYLDENKSKMREDFIPSEE